MFHNVIWWIYFALFLIAFIGIPIFSVFVIIGIGSKNKKQIICTLTGLVMCLVVFVSYICPTYSRTDISKKTVEKIAYTEISPKNKKMLKIADGGTWESETSIVHISIYENDTSDGELFIYKDVAFYLFGTEKENQNMHFAIYPREICRDFLEIVPDYSNTTVSLLDKSTGEVFDISMFNKNWEKKDDDALNEFLSDLSGDTSYGEFVGFVGE